MPLNLLQHKSWHVGSAKNQERVRRDERAAQLKEEEEERRMQLADAEHRLKLLRERGGHAHDGVSLHVDQDDTSISTSTATTTSRPGDTATTEWGRRDSRKRRRDEHPEGNSGGTRDISLVGTDGHINLFPEGAQTRPSRNAEYAADQKRKEDELEAQYTMRLSRPSEPWYSTTDGVAEADRKKDERDRKREERVERRAREEGDPMNAMRRGLAQLREVRQDAAQQRRRRDREVGLGLGEHHKHGSRSHHRHHRHSHRHRSRSRSRSRSPRREKSDTMEALRAERRAREAAERARADAVVADELAARRRPERWTASAAGGRGLYSSQFQH
ncbi:hypothetical protein TWF696_004539 [Orbilia brochopaga]|uniref:CBF1-interacting co-repressor CIR N-terminal domain-containing protein n=1 Tax=Orbilia brochopaga TaxID=3140254 RepID=A0AAV9V902_9PEZI